MDYQADVAEGKMLKLNSKIFVQTSNVLDGFGATVGDKKTIRISPVGSSVVEIFSYNGEKSISFKAPAEHSLNDDLVIDVKQLITISKNHKDKDLVFEKKSNKILIKADKTKYSLPLISSEFPDPPNFETKEKISLDHVGFRRNLSNVIYAASTNQARANLNCVKILCGEMKHVYACATDGSRLAVSGKQSGECVSFLLPIDFAKTLNQFIFSQKDIDVFEIETTPTQNIVRFTIDQFKLTTSLIDSNFPDVSSLLTLKSNHTVDLTKDLLSDPIKRLLSIAPKDTRGIDFSECDGSLLLSHSSDEIDASEQIDIPFPKNSKFTVNGFYFLESLQASQFPCKLQFDKRKDPVFLINENTTAIIMPMDY